MTLLLEGKSALSAAVLYFMLYLGPTVWIAYLHTRQIHYYYYYSTMKMFHKIIINNNNHHYHHHHPRGKKFAFVKLLI